MGWDIEQIKLQILIYQSEIKDSSTFSKFLDNGFKHFIDSNENLQSKIQFFKILVNLEDFLLLTNYLKWIEEFDFSYIHVPGDIKDPNKHKIYNRILLLLNSVDAMVLYNNGFYPKLLQSKDPEIINTLYQSIEFKENFKLKNELFPHDLLCQAIKSNPIHNCIDLLLMSVNSMYFSKLKYNCNFSNLSQKRVEESLQVNKKRNLNVELVRSTIQAVVSFFPIISPLDKSLYTSVNDRSKTLEKLNEITFILCQFTFQNLNSAEIQSLKYDYIQLLPLICAFALPLESPGMKYGYTNNDIYQDLNSKNKLERDYISNLIKHYGREFIEQEFTNLFPKLLSSAKRDYQIFLGLVYHMMDSECVKAHLNEIYQIMHEIEHHTISFPGGFVLSKLLNKYGITNTNHFRFFYEEKKQCYHLPKCVEFDLYVTLLALNTQYTIENMDSILEVFNNYPSNFLIYLNMLLVKPPFKKAFREITRFQEFHKKIQGIANKSQEHYIHLLEYIISVEPKSQYHNLIVNFSKTLNEGNKSPLSGKQYLIRDDHFYEVLLKFYTAIKPLHLKEANNLFNRTLKSFVKLYAYKGPYGRRKKLSLDIILPYIKDLKQLNNLFIQMDTYLSPTSRVKIFKYFLDLNLVDEDYIIGYLNSMIEDIDVFPITAMILDQMKSFINLEPQIQDLLSQLPQFIEASSITNIKVEVVASLYLSLNDMTLTYQQYIESFIEAMKDAKQLKSENLLIFDAIHKQLFDVTLQCNHCTNDHESLCVHSYFVGNVLTKYKLSDHNVEFTKLLLPYLSSVKILSPKLTTLILNQFKETKSTQKENILFLIRQKQITQLYFLFDPKQTGHRSFHSPIPQQHLNQSTPYVQNLIIQNIVSFICGDPSVTPIEILELSLTSKIFFQGVAKIFNCVKIPSIAKVKSTYSFLVSPWSLFSVGCYHMDYSSISRFNYQHAEDIFYQLGSLNLNTTSMIYQVNRELKNLTKLTIHLNFPNSINDTICNLLSFCHGIVSFRMYIKIRGDQLKQSDNIQLYLNALFQNNKESLRKLKLYYPLTNALDGVFQSIKEFEMNNPQNNFKSHNKLLIEYFNQHTQKVHDYLTALNYCTKLHLDFKQPTAPWFLPEYFPNLNSLEIENEFSSFPEKLLSNLNTIETLTIHSRVIELYRFYDICSQKENLKTLKVIYHPINHYMQNIDLVTIEELEKLLCYCSKNPTITNVYFMNTNIKFDSLVTLNLSGFQPVNNQYFIKINK
ncbi:hypothetical protein DLAC_02325 [Tieghemostelium lacteum]|uniref:Uncharacterized protein n=1 Tax=Tieghemostelium lacteum TaxID=361077 RepID=A0A152A552_TIELA|nr:hypothetical protein DLAC_02325 [Tieghemostelium lacteum]|eukprot:KYR01207.1 hypothetical protein DLAC_02325 [Tieghemostelium lacteum]